MDSPSHPDSPMNDDDAAYPCKGCNEILEEGKAFELAGNRWHINCFRCNTCKTLLDSDANLLLLGDGSLICNNCTYSCSACQNKIEDLAILTGDQAFCASCFKCRNCRRKIENLRYARTSQGIFCMTCHESLMARRKKKTRQAHTPQQPSKPPSNSQSPMLLDKTLPQLPPPLAPPLSSSSLQSAPLAQSSSITASEPFADYTPVLTSRGLANDQADGKLSKRDKPASIPDDQASDTTLLPSTTYNGTPTSTRHSMAEAQDPISPGDPMGSFIPVMFDDRPAVGPSPHLQNQTFEQPPLRKDSAPDSSRLRESSSNDSEHPGSARQPMGRKEGDGRGQQKKIGSPHVAYQEKGRQPSSELTDLIKNKSRREQDRDAVIPKEHGAVSNLRTASGLDDSRVQLATPPQANGTAAATTGEQFKLQEVPRNRRSGGSRPGSRSDVPLINGARDQQGSITRTESPSSLTSRTAALQGQSLSDSRSASLTSASSQLMQKPKREDSLPLQQKQTLRKEVPSSHSSKSLSTSPKAGEYSTTPDPLGISLQASPSSQEQGGLEINGARPIPPARAKARPQYAAGESFSPPHSGPPLNSAPINSFPNSLPTSGSQIATPPSAGTVQTDYSRDQEGQTSPALPQYNRSGDFSIGMEDDFKRILAGNDEDATKILEKVTKAVRHGRSASEAGATRAEPIDPALNMGQKDDPYKLESKLRNSLKRIAELEACVRGSTDIKSIDTKLREKRSTAAYLDSQKEMIVNELEVLARHVAQTKHTDEPLDFEGLANSMLRDFSIALEKVKDEHHADIGNLIQQKEKLLEELADLNKKRDQAIIETTQLNTRNAQLADLNNELTQQIQERYKVHRHPSAGQVSVSAPSADTVSIESPRANGLGIYNHQHHPSGDQREFRPSTAGNSSLSNTYVQTPDPPADAEPATFLSAPHVVNIRKGQAKKFNWKKGGQSVAKGVSKGIKGAFSSSSQSHNPQGPSGQHQNIEAVPYGMHTPGDAPTIVHRVPQNEGGKPRSNLDKLFGASNLAPRGPSPQAMRSNSNGNIHGGDEGKTLYGFDLTERADMERRAIPSIVTRCIEEVELRGMDVEGIYRKTGGNSLTKTIQEGFEHSEDYDISDPELDITSVTSALKQYLRNLPIPLLHYDVYDRMLNCIMPLPKGYFNPAKGTYNPNEIVGDIEMGIVMMKALINDLPQKHHDTLEFLVFHLARVWERVGENKMNPRNLATVFAPTIMWDRDTRREITDMHEKNDAIHFLIQHNKMIFAP
ncbi:MAG: Rho-type gtpase-activating protein [Vezdaea aestivalis]|nr:MAG: Rho-type gtpase-activating protein [Vezdaea aestivalis]